MYIVLNVIYLLAGVLLLPLALFKAAISERWRAGLLERFGAIRRRESDAPCFWIHAASVGEVMTAKPLVLALLRDFPSCEVVISTNTNTGQRIAKEAFPALRTFYLPFDFSWLAEKALHRLRPTALMLVELELWPNLLAAAYRRHIPVLVANGRIMPRSAKAYRFLKTLFPRFARAMAAATYCAQNEEYAQRLQALGVPRSRTHIAGNVKFDGLRTAADSQRLRSLVEAFAIRAEDRVLVAGSTWPGEERILLNVYKELRQQFDNLRLVLVPRHIERAGEVEKQIEDAGFKCYRRTSLSSEAVGANGLRQGVVLVDTVGELATVYALATCVFVGKSLVPLGGQNMMEPAALGKPVLFGPHTFNFKREVELLLRHEAAQVVGTEQELLQGLKALLSDSERAAHMARRAQKVIVTNQGATGRHMEVLKKVLESAHGG